LLFLCCQILAGNFAFGVLKWVQIAAFFGAILLVGKIANHLISSTKIAYAVVITYAFLPCFHGFMYFTLTESITPFLLLWSTWSWLKTPPQKSISWEFMFSAGMLLLVRPQLLVFIFFFLLAWVIEKRFKLFFVSLLLFVPLLSWNIRSSWINHHWTGIHPIYSETNNTLYRPSHRAMTDLFRIWEADAAHFHETIARLTKDTTAKTTEDALQQIPMNYRAHVRPIFKSFQQIHATRVVQFAATESIHKPLRGEAQFLKRIEYTTNQLVAENKADYYLITPLRSAKILLVNSHLNLGIFQFKWRGFLGMEIMRWMCLLLLLAGYLASFFWLLKPFKTTFWIALGICFSLFYLIYIQRLNEERYLTPILPLCLVLLGNTLNHFVLRGKRTEK
jgi:hypothetical protein